MQDAQEGVVARLDAQDCCDGGGEGGSGAGVELALEADDGAEVCGCEEVGEGEELGEGGGGKV